MKENEIREYVSPEAKVYNIVISNHILEGSPGAGGGEGIKDPDEI